MTRTPLAVAVAPDRRSPPSAFVEITHHGAKGRLRFSVLSLRRNVFLEQQLQLFFARRTGEVELRSLSLWTGSILIMAKAVSTQRAAERLRLELEHLVRACLDKYQQETQAYAARRRLLPAPARNAARLQQPMPAALPPRERAWHEMSADAVVKELNTSDSKGLSQTEAAKRLLDSGPNLMPTAVAHSRLQRLVHQFWNLPSGLLGASAGLSLLLRELVDAALIGGVVAANAGIGYAMESKAEKVIGGLDMPTLTGVLVVRDGLSQWVDPASLVVGDVVLVRAGPVFADLRLCEVAELAVDESALTGESLPVNKSTVAAATGALGDRAGMLFRGTVVVGGSGKGIVVAIGGATEAGKIHALISGVRPPATPLQRRLDDLGVTLVWLSGGICLGIFFLGMVRGLGALRMLKSAVSLAVAALPEGLPTVGTMTLALGIKQLEQSRVLVRKLAAVENLGAVNELCFDKTGTITFNRLAVARVSSGLQTYIFAAQQLYEESQQKPVAIADLGSLQLLILVALLCNDATQPEASDPTDASNAGSSSNNSSSTEAALLSLAVLLSATAAQVVKAYPRLNSRYRSQTTRYMATLHRSPAGSLLLAVKGSPEEVLGYCRWYCHQGKIVRLTKNSRARIQALNAAYAGEALRVLGLAYKQPSSSDDTDAQHDLVWLGLVGLKDELRPGVKELLVAFHQAGIRTSMITGDQEATAQALRRELDLAPAPDGSGRGPGRSHLHVYARVNPADKLKIVQSLQSDGRVVAMTGDGVNDSPALRAADVGIAMGSGAAVARDAAEVVLANNELATLFEAVKLGRSIRDNLGKAVHFLLATNLSEILVLLGGVAVGRPDALTPRQLLWINLLTDVLPALALAVEAPESGTMTRPPRDPNGPLFSPGEWRSIVWEAVALATGPLAIMQAFSGQHGGAKRAQTEAVSTMTFFALTIAQLLHTHSSRFHLRSSPAGAPARPANPWISGGIVAGLGVQLATVALPSLRALLGNAVLRPRDMVLAGLGGVAPYLLVEGVKALNLSWMHDVSSP